MENSHYPLFVGLHSEHHPKRMKDVRLSALIELAGMGLDRYLNRAFKSCHKLCRGPLRKLSQRVTCASTALGIPHKHAVLNKLLDVAQRCVVRAFGQCRPFGTREFALKAIEHPVDHEP